MTKRTYGDYTLYCLDERIEIHSDTPHSDTLRHIIMEVIDSYLDTMSKAEKKEFFEYYFKANLYNYLPNL